MHLSWARSARAGHKHMLRQALLPPTAMQCCIRMKQSKNHTDVPDGHTTAPGFGNANPGCGLVTQGKKSNLIWSFMEIFSEPEITDWAGFLTAQDKLWLSQKRLSRPFTLNLVHS